jgi:hypothetical protein
MFLDRGKALVPYYLLGYVLEKDFAKFFSVDSSSVARGYKKFGLKCLEVDENKFSKALMVGF